MLKMTPQELIIHRAKEPPSGLSGWFGSVVCYPCLVWFCCRWYTEENKIYRLCVPMQTQPKKKSKWKGGDIFKETTTNHDVLSWRVRAVTSFEGFVQNHPVFHSFVICFVLIGKVLIFLFFWWAGILFKSRRKLYSNLGWAPKHYGQWHHFATTVTKPGTCCVSSVLQFCGFTLACATGLQHCTTG